MSDIRSFVRRNSRLNEGHKKHLVENNGMLVSHMPIERINKAQYVGLEIGFGMGDSLLDVAEKNPSQLWLGFEVYEIGIASVIRQAKLLSLDNILLQCGDAVVILSEDFPENSIDHIRIFFPDPWPKKRHNKRRIMQSNLLNVIARVMKPGAKLHFATDNVNYAEETKLLLESHQQYKVSEEKLYRPETKFARKAKAEGSHITDIIAVITH